MIRAEGVMAPSASATGAPGQAITFETRAMASPLRLTVAVKATANGAVDPRAELAWSAVVDEFDRSDKSMSRFRDDSDVTRLNRLVGRPVVGTPWRLRRALVACDRARRVTDGRFEPRELDVLARIGYGGASLGDAPSPSRAERVLELDRRRGTVTVTAPVDLGGIGKGLALRWAARGAAAAASGLGFLIEAGGDVVAVRPAPDGGPWRVGIEDPRALIGTDTPAVGVVALHDGAVATTSIRRNRWPMSDGRVVHHLIDPETREPSASDLLAVTVAHPDPAWAEIHAKSLFLMGTRGIGPEARALGLAAWWVDAGGSLEMTPAARLRTIWTS